MMGSTVNSMNTIKRLTFTFILLITSALTFAQVDSIGGGVGNDGGGPKQSWSEIYNNPNLLPQFPSYDVAGRQISYKNLCLYGERIRTKYKYVISQDSLFKIVYDYLIVDRVREETRCRREENRECVDWETLIFEIPLKKEVKVLEKKETPDGIKWVESFEKDYELKECKYN